MNFIKSKDTTTGDCNGRISGFQLHQFFELRGLAPFHLFCAHGMSSKRKDMIVYHDGSGTNEGSNCLQAQLLPSPPSS
ncbi:hypothetical protein NC652_006752 [Populus alba x Populus x berolinensis]|uniref:Uncharacterized protein n=1 Tax=Populus alba x Populus x berolinensis TaxID=444605 RepID=A0AAD6RG21_9ROSI|nr:hypothetical protein NC652_006752 [Populus alba x Populus x berolinensis]KAJ7007735.1 hypothetical protein NC653_006689 [Populus alba x Populus x berolinensis]